jgi:lipopolysaccharide export system permease protein
MLFQSSIRTELGRSFGASLLVLFTIVVTIMLIRTLGLATTGGVNPKEVMLVLGYTVLGRVHIILTMATFVAVVSVIGRMHRDSEMVIWLGAGTSLMGMIRPIFRFAWPILATMLVLVMVVWPWANQQSEELRTRFTQRGDLERVQPGQFQANARGDRVFFIDKHSDSPSAGKNVLISARGSNGESTISAQSATVGTNAEGQTLTFLNGQRLELLPQGQGTRVSAFEEYVAQLDAVVLPPASVADMKAKDTWSLLTDPSSPARGELAWRLGLLISAVNLILLALVAATTNPRAGRGANIVFAIFAFLTYSNTLNLGTTWITAEKVSFWGWTLGFHGLVFGAVMLALFKQQQGFSLRAWFRRLRDRALVPSTGAIT